MKQIVNVKRIFIDEDFDFLVGLLTDLKKDNPTQLVSTDEDFEIHDFDLQIIGHRLYTHPQNPTLNVLEVDYVSRLESPTSPEEVVSSSNLPTPDTNC